MASVRHHLWRGLRRGLRGEPKFKQQVLAGMLSHMHFFYLLSGVFLNFSSQLTVDSLDAVSFLLTGLAVGQMDKDRGNAFVA